ncbi:MAG: hypothetical protein U0470_01745 [Anaerolineae bacterium]
MNCTAIWRWPFMPDTAVLRSVLRLRPHDESGSSDHANTGTLASRTPLGSGVAATAAGATASGWCSFDFVQRRRRRRG